MARKKKIRETLPSEALPPEENAAPTEAVAEEAEAPVTETPVTETEAAPEPDEAAPISESRVANDFDNEPTVDLSGSSPMLPLRDDVADELEATDEPAAEAAPATTEGTEGDVSRKHLRGLLEALIFASDKPLKANEIAKLASAPTKQVKELLDELRLDYVNRGVQLDEIAGGWLFRTNMQYAPFVRDLTGQRPVRLSRAQLETLAIVAYRQPVTRPEVDDIRGVDCGAVLKLLLERDLVRILGKKDEPGRPILYGTSTGFLELFGLKSLKELPTLREFTELNEDSLRTVADELGDELEQRQGVVAEEPSPATTTDGDRPTLESAADLEDPDPDAVETKTDDDDVHADEQAEPAELGASEGTSSSYNAADELEFPDDDDDDDDDDEDEDDEDEDDEDEDDDEKGDEKGDDE